MQFDDPDADAMDVTELLVATADHADLGLDPCVQEVLRLVRDRMKVDAVFVRASRPSSGLRGDFQASEPASQPLEAAWGEHVLGERLPAEEAGAATHHSTPVTLADGGVYGTLCACSRSAWTSQSDQKMLRSTAILIAQKIDQGRRPLRAPRSSWGDLRSAAGARPRFEGDPTHP